MTGSEQLVVEARGRKTGVILSVRRYRELMEDLYDLAVVAERRAEKPISLDAFKRRSSRMLRADRT